MDPGELGCIHEHSLPYFSESFQLSRVDETVDYENASASGLLPLEAIRAFDAIPQKDLQSHFLSGRPGHDAVSERMSERRRWRDFFLGRRRRR